MPRTKPTREANGRSTIYQDKKTGRWHGYVTVGRKPNGKPDRRHREAATLTDVTEKVRQLEKERDAGKTLKTNSRTTVAEWLRLWLEIIAPRDAQKRSVDIYRRNIERWIIPFIGGILLKDLSMEDVDALHVRLLRREHLSRSMVHKVHQALSSALNAAVARDHIGRNVAALVGSPGVSEAEIEPLTRTQARALIQHATKLRGGTRWSVALALGLRQSEALGMRWKYLDLDTGILRVWKLRREEHAHGCQDPHTCGAAHHVRRPCPKGCTAHQRCPRTCVATCTQHARYCPQRIDGHWVFEAPKSGKTRKIKVPATLLAALRAHRAAQQRERLAAGELWQDWDLVFCRGDGTPITKNADRRCWKELCAQAGVPTVRVHDARHTAGTLLAEQGIDTGTAMRLLGHTNPTMTRRYQHLTDELRDQAARRMDDALFG